MSEATPRRWFTLTWLRFSLRSMLIAVTIFAVWLGWEVSFVRRRAVWQEQHKRDWNGALYISEKWGRPVPQPFSFWRAKDMDGEVAHIPIWREWIGDAAVSQLIFEPGLPDEECRRLYRLFPEAISVLKTERTDDELLFYRYTPSGTSEPLGSINLRGIRWER